ncbi:hypothetical protein BTVI_14851 [Pitangus sulphuratus]|nr:hypothetical protein BTVI_14851 [Pitangus sulphuratus]
MDNKLFMGQQCFLVVKDNGVLEYIKKNISGTLKEVIPPLHPALVRPHLKCCVQFWAPQYKREMELLEQVQQRATEMINGLEHPSQRQAERVEPVQH